MLAGFPTSAQLAAAEGQLRNIATLNPQLARGLEGVFKQLLTNTAAPKASDRGEGEDSPEDGKGTQGAHYRTGRHRQGARDAKGERHRDAAADLAGAQTYSLTGRLPNGLSRQNEPLSVLLGQLVAQSQQGGRNNDPIFLMAQGALLA